MNKVILLFLLIILFQAGSCANLSSSQQEFDYKTHVKKRLQLTDKQENSYWLIMELYESRKHIIIEKYRNSRDVTGWQDELTVLSDETMKSLEILFSEEQMNEWHKLVIESMLLKKDVKTPSQTDKFPSGGGRPPPGGGRRGR